MTVGAKEDQIYASPDDLTRPFEIPSADVRLPSGVLVRVRGLTRIELILNGKGTEDADEIERRNVATCMLRPTMTREQVRKWQKSSLPGDLAAVTNKIRDLSGLGEGAPKSDVAEVRD